MNRNMNLNQRDISKSYFINKSKIKNKLKTKFEEIRDYEDFIDSLNKIDKQTIKYPCSKESIYEQTIKTTKIRIQKIKLQIKRETNVYFY